MVKGCAALALVMGLGACVSHLKPLPPVAPHRTAGASAPVKLSDQARQTRLKALVLDLPVGYRYGQSSWGSNGCTEKRPHDNTEGRVDLDEKRFGEVFHAVMKRRGYPVEDQIELFADSKERVAELQVAGRIFEATFNECYPDIWRDKLLVRGNAYLKVEWSVYSPLEKKVLLSVVTEGSTYQEVESRVGQQGILRVAVADALERLASLEEYRKVVDAPKPVAATAASGPRLRIKALKTLVGDLKKNLPTIRQAVVTVTANKGSGSGFVISADGKLLTAEHVVSGSKYVKVMTATGKECYGEVAAASKQRDLAILQVDCGELTPLPAGRRQIGEGDEVFAIGTPFSTEKLEFSVTKGVVSGIRKIDELDFIQSDVRILPGNSGGPLLDASGNVIGVSTSGLAYAVLGVRKGGLAMNPVPAGVNFFVPLSDLERYLPVDFE